MRPQTSAVAEPVRSDFAADPDFRELLVEFTAALPSRRDGLTEAHRAERFDLMRTTAHQLKGAGGGFGFPRLSELAAELEQAVVSKEPVRIAEALESTVAYMNRITV